MDNRPIGVFDSGIGGLTVAKEIMKLLPNEKIIYFGDTARVPYGSKSKETIIKYSKQIIQFLLTKDVKTIVIACNTASSYALETVKELFDLPIIDVVNPGAKMALESSKTKRIGVIGTEGTISSGIYEKLINANDTDAAVIGQPCPLFVPLVEEGWIDDLVTYTVADRYLTIFKEQLIDTLVLGCTHYPLLKDVVGDIMGEEVSLVNPAYETTIVLKRLLEEQGLNAESRNVSHKFYVSDRAEKFESFAKRILNKPMMPVQKINIESY